MAIATHKPDLRPADPNFSSGPCAKRPGFTLHALKGAFLGRSHRAEAAKGASGRGDRPLTRRARDARRLEARHRSGLRHGRVRDGAMVPARRTAVDVLSFESFSEGWATDVVKQLKLPDARVLKAAYGSCRISLASIGRTTSSSPGTARPPACASRMAIGSPPAARGSPSATPPRPRSRWISWDKLDVVTWSWQKVLGGEAAHGMLALSPRAVERLESYKPAWPLPKIFRLTKNGELIDGIFKGDTINTPSMLCVEDAIDGLAWAESVGGVRGLIARSEANLAAIAGWVERSEWAAFLADDPAVRSCTSICLRIVAPWFAALPAEAQWDAAKQLASLLDREGVAYDIAAYRDAPPGLRIWGGATVEPADIEALLPWLDWAYAQVAAKFAPAAAAE